MKTFGIVGASHFCTAFASHPTSAAISVRDFLELPGKRHATYSENSSIYDELRDCILRNSERSMLMSIVSFARALESLRASSAFWALTGFYYSSFFGAHAILGMFGCWMGGQRNWIDVQDTSPGSQTLVLHRNPYNRSVKGSHQLLWNAFYGACGSLSSWVGPKAAVALTPVNSQVHWLIDARNAINYGTWDALKLAADFRDQFDATKVPACFPGRLMTVITVASAFIECMRDLTQQLSLKTDVVVPSATRADWIRDHALETQDPSIAGFCSGYRPTLTF